MQINKTIRETIEYTLDVKAPIERPEDTPEVIMNATITEVAGVIDKVVIQDQHGDMVYLDAINDDAKSWQALSLIVQNIVAKDYKAE